VSDYIYIFMAKKTTKENIIERPPIIVIMGHIDHGKSALLDYIRKSNVVEGEAGGITQHLSAYEVDRGGKKITFLDTPGHAAFSDMRSRGATIADIAILIVSAEDGPKTQTIEALASIKKAGLPYIVAINKIDRPAANVEKTKQDLAEKEIFIEGYGGDIPAVPISAKTGEGIDELLDTMLLVAEVEELKGDSSKPAEGVVVESHLDPKKGISATLVVRDGALKKGMHVVAGETSAPVRILEDFAGKAISDATFSSPITITGWSGVPPVGSEFVVVKGKKEAELVVKENHVLAVAAADAPAPRVMKDENILYIPLVIKTDVAGTLEAIEQEIKKIKHDDVILNIVQKDVGKISENDIKLVAGSDNAIVVGFGVKTETRALDIADRFGVTIKTFDIIYEITEWLEAEVAKRAPKKIVEEVTGEAKVIRIFSQTKNKQVLGAKVREGVFNLKSKVNIVRRGNKIGTGEIVELQQQKAKTDSVQEGNEFGAMIASTYCRR